ncbi:NAD-dependent succinate-semialdehyde dehydrogenase [bacterium]|nr:NAD-dependent succinate-semialdehyde dehydrogenase [candidate division CSSED10-310 bacterium]
MICTVNPLTGETLARYQQDDIETVRGTIDRTAAQYTAWCRTPFPERAALFNRLAERLRAHADEYARIMALEMGKPVREGRAEIEKCAWVCEYYATHAARFLADVPVDTGARKSYVTYRPMGVVLAVMPWNFPFWQVFRCAVPTMMAGNTMLLKHASNVSGCARAIASLFLESGAPDHLFSLLVISADRVAEVIAHPAVRAVTLTGGTPAGRAVAAEAGRHLKKVVLELGGSDPYIVLADADLDESVSKCIAGRMLNAGQSCIAAKRLIVVRSILDIFTHRLIDGMSRITWGDPMAPDTGIGPLARRELRDELHEQVTESVRCGARLRLGGEIHPGPGALYPPTVLDNVQPGMPACDEELFGPVAVIIPAETTEDALHLANQSSFGLGGAVFTADTNQGEQLARDAMEVGCCFVNDFVRSDPRLLFGGIKNSGFGRELGIHGIHEFVNIKTVYVR